MATNNKVGTVTNLSLTTCSNEIVEDGRESARYDVDKGDIVIKIPKQVEGQEFEDLEMISKLLAPKPSNNPTIEVLDSDGDKSVPLDLENIPEDFTWEWDQVIKCLSVQFLHKRSIWS